MLVKQHHKPSIIWWLESHPSTKFQIWEWFIIAFRNVTNMIFPLSGWFKSNIHSDVSSPRFANWKPWPMAHLSCKKWWFSIAILYIYRFTVHQDGTPGVSPFRRWSREKTMINHRCFKGLYVLNFLRGTKLKTTKKTSKLIYLAEIAELPRQPSWMGPSDLSEVKPIWKW